jgi:hypothetical protein
MSELHQFGPTKFEDLLKEYRLLSQLVTSRDRLIMNRFLPSLEAYERRVKHLETAVMDMARRQDLIENAVADLSAIFYKHPPKTH